MNFDQLPTIDALRVINSEDQKVASAVAEILPSIAIVVDRIVEKLRSGGRLFYVGTGTSGRLGVLDASEIPPTFGVPPDLVQGVIAGGFSALYRASEASEDDREQGADDMRSLQIDQKDAVIGIAASGKTRYTIGAVEYARKLGAYTACIVCVPESELTKAVESPLVVVVGPEVITGSTRMKSGTAQKMILNMISTLTMVRLGYVRGNEMTNLKTSNVKLRERSLRILMEETGLEIDAAGEYLRSADDDLRVALVMFATGKNKETALSALKETDFVVEKAVKDIKCKL